MAERSATPWIVATAAIVALAMAVFAWFAWQGREEAGVAARTAVEAIPDVRPQLPREPHLPTPIPVPK